MLKTLMVTSIQQAEGKTTSVLNMGKAFAHTGYKVLMADADLFRPRLGKMLDLGKNKVLSDFLLKDEHPNNLIANTNIENLYILPAGLIPPNPAELIGSKKIKALFDMIKDSYDIIIIDSAPINATIDVSVLGSYADGIAIAVKAHHTTKQHLRKGITEMKQFNGNILG